MNALRAVIEKYPEHEFSLRRLFASDAEFKTLCEDYALATRALDRWTNDPHKAEHYKQLAGELEDEIREFIEGRHPHQIGKGIGH